MLTYVQTEFFLHVCVRNFCFYIYNNVISDKVFVFAEILRYLHYFMNRDKFVPTNYFGVCVCLAKFKVNIYSFCINAFLYILEYNRCAEFIHY